MEISREELSSVLASFNPWWEGGRIPDLPSWHRAVFDELLNWTLNPPVSRAVLLSGARQVGKTTLLLQIIKTLLKQGVPASNIVYVTFDHPLIKLAGTEAVLSLWKEKQIVSNGPEFLFLDEAQFAPHWGTWIKHQVDFFKNRRIVFTGSSLPLIQNEPESGVGRIHTVRLATLSFYEYLQLKNRKTSSINLDLQNIPENFKKAFEALLPNIQPIDLPQLPKITSMEELFLWKPNQLHELAIGATSYVPHFYEYLARGGFPQTAQVESVTQAQKLLREDIVDKVLKRDMTALFGVRRIQELEQTFLYLCMHDGGQLNMEQLSKNLEVKKPTAKNFIELLETTHLIYRLPRFGYGKEVLRGRDKIYLADAAMAPAVFLKGKSFIDNPDSLGRAVETAVFKHLYVHYPDTARFTYWQGKNNHEVDVIAEQAGKYIPFEIKQEAKIDKRDFRGLLEFCREKEIDRAYIITKSLGDIGLQEQKIAPNTQILKIPAVLFCYWLGSLELKNE